MASCTPVVRRRQIVIPRRFAACSWSEPEEQQKKFPGRSESAMELLDRHANERRTQNEQRLGQLLRAE